MNRQGFFYLHFDSLGHHTLETKERIIIFKLGNYSGEGAFCSVTFPPPPSHSSRTLPRILILLGALAFLATTQLSWEGRRGEGRQLSYPRHCFGGAPLPRPQAERVAWRC